MRITTALFIIAIIFAGGMFTGLMYNPAEKITEETDKTEQHAVAEEKRQVEREIEAELHELNEFPDDSERQVVRLEHVADHPVQKAAHTFEKGTTYFFEKIVTILYSISQLLF